MREPDFSSPEFHGAVQDEIERVVAKWAMRVLIWIIVAICGSLVTIIAAAVWMDRVYIEIKAIGVRQQVQEAATNDRIATWAVWRQEVDSHLRAIDGRTGDRWTRASQRDYNSQLGTLNRTLILPDVDIIGNRQGPP